MSSNTGDVKEMYFAYIDESGKPEMSHLDNEFIILALIIHERDWFNIQNNANSLKSEIWSILGHEGEFPEDFELHIAEISNGTKNSRSRFKSKRNYD